MPTLKLGLAALLMAATAMPVMAADLRIGLQEDPDVLDPDQSRTFVGRIVYASLCDKLVDITPDLEIVPMLATGWEWSEDGTSLTFTLRDDVVFHDGEPFNATAVAANLERTMTLPESRRKSEVASIAGTEVIDESTIRIDLTAPDATLLAQLADRAGMMMSPKAAAEAGADFGNNLVCSGPFKFTERVQQDRIVLDKFAEYYDADRIAFDRVIFLPNSGHHGSAREPALGRSRHDRAARRDRLQIRRRGREPSGRRGGVAGLSGDHGQRRQRRKVREPARPGRPGAKGPEPRDRPRGHQ